MLRLISLTALMMAVLAIGFTKGCSSDKSPVTSVDPPGKPAAGPADPPISSVNSPGKPAAGPADPPISSVNSPGKPAAGPADPTGKPAAGPADPTGKPAAGPADPTGKPAAGPVDPTGKTVEAAKVVATPEADLTPEEAQAELARLEIPYEAWAFILYAQMGELNAVKLFVQAGMSLATTNPQTPDGFTALHTAATYGHLAVVQYLVEQGASINAQGTNGETALMWAALNGHLEIVEYLVGQGASLTATTTRGQTSKDLASGDDHTAVVTYLESPQTARASLTAQDIYTAAAFVDSAKAGNLEVVKLFVQAGMDVNARHTANRDNTALMQAAMRGHLEVVQYLVGQGASLTATNNNGKTPKDLASENGHTAVVTYLESQAPPDLVVESPSVDNTTPNTGQTLTLSATVRNQGTGAAAATTLRYYQSSDATISTGDTEVGTAAAISGLAAAATSAQSSSATAPSTAGTYYYGACVESVSGETNTDNNCSTGVQVTVQAPPDLVVESPSVDNTTPNTGQSLTLSATVRNQGAGAAAATTLRYYQSSDATISTGDTEVGTAAAISGLAAAATSAQSSSLTAPSTAGTYYYGACVESGSRETKTDNNCSAGVQVTVQAPPDLVVESPSVDNTTPNTGQTLTLSATVRNQGTGAAAATTLRYYQSSDATISTGDTEVGTAAAISGLAASGTSAQSSSLTAPSTAGTYYYGACVESGSGETNTDNNCSAGVQVTVQAPPDLVVESPSVDNTTPNTGQTLTLSATVRNQGTGAAAATTLRYYQSSDATISTGDTEVGTAAAISGLAASGTSAQSRSLTAPSTAGTYYYGACVESGSGETNTDNNCSTGVQVTVQAPPDLVVESPSVDNTTPNTGQTLTLSATVRNQGTGAAAATTLRYYQSSDATISTGDTEVGTAAAISGLAASGTSAQSRSLTAPSTAGTYYYGACVESGSGETNTDNNCSAGVQVTVQAPPDLVVESPSVDNTTPNTGQTLTLSATVRNQGTGAAAATTLRYYQSSDATIAPSDTEVGTAAAISGLAASGTSAQSSSATAPSTAGTYYYGACVESGSGETNTDNNCSAGVQVTVSTKADAARAELTARGISYTADAFVDSAAAGNLEVVKLFVQAGMSVDTAKSSKWPALHMAVGHLEVVQYLVGQGASLTATDTNGETALHMAANRSYLAVVKYLAVVQYLVGQGASPTATSPSGYTPLHYAANRGSLAVVQYLVGQGASPTATDNEGRTPLHWAAYDGHLEVVQYLVGQGASATVTSIYGETALHRAASGGHLALVKYLVGQGASLTATNNSGLTALHWAAASGRNLEVVQYLVGQGASLTATDNKGQTPKDLASQYGHTAVVTYLESQAPPDLVVESPSVDNTTPNTGQTLTLSATVRNQGTGAAAATTLRYYQSSDATIAPSDTEVGTAAAISGLAASGTSAQSSSLTAPSTAGTYYYGACVESGSRETNTDNNCSTGVQVTVQAPPDLVVESPSVDNTTPNTGQTLTLSATVRNQGTGAAAATTLRYYQSSDATISTGDTEVGTAAAISGLAASGTSAQSRSLTAPSTAGTYYYGACVESGSRETNTDNNCSTGVQVTVSTKADAARAELTRRGISYTADAFVDSAEAGNLEVVKLFVQAGMSVDTAKSGKWRVLHTAAQNGHLAVVQYLVGQGASLTATDTNTETALHKAANHGHLAVVQYLVGQGASPTATTHLGYTPLHNAAQNGHLAVVQYLVGQGASPTATDNQGRTPLYWAASGHLEVVQYLVGQGASATVTSIYGETALHWAISRNGSLALVQYLVGQGASLTATTNSDGWTPLHWAAASGRNLEVVQYLVGQGASLTATTNKGKTPKDLASQNGHTAVVTYLESQAPPDLVVESPSVDNTTPNTGQTLTLSATVRNQGTGAAAATTLRYYQSSDATIAPSDTEVGTAAAISGLAASGTSAQSRSLTAPSTAGTYYYGACVESDSGETNTDNNCSTGVQVTVSTKADAARAELTAQGISYTADAFVDSAAAGNLEVVKLFVQAGMSVDTAKSGKWPALHMAVGHDHLEVVKYLVGQGASLTATDTNGETALYMAARSYLAVVQYLVGQGASPTVTSNNGYTPLHYAAGDGNLAVVQYLVGQGASPTATDNQGRTPLYWAASGHLEVVQYLVGQGASVTVTSIYGETALHWAISNNGSLAVVKYLVGQGASLTATTNLDSYTPLHWAAIQGHLAIVQYLVGQGASLTATDNKGYTPKDLASNQGHTAVVTYLESQAPPDLVVESPSVDNTTPNTGQTLTLSATVRNQGTGAAAATTLRYYQSSDATIAPSDTEVGTAAAISGLAASGTSAQSRSLTAPSTAGTYYYGACVESGSGETNTDNNCSTGVQVTVTVMTAAAFVDSAKAGNLEVVKLFVQAGMDVNAKHTANRDNTALMQAAMRGHLEVVKYLVGQGANVNAANIYGTTAFMKAAGHGHLEVVQYLVEQGANINAVETQYNKTGLMFAAGGGHTAVVTYLESQAPPDLVVEPPSVDNTTPNTGQSLTLSATVRNQGTGAAAATTLRYYQSSDATIAPSDTEVGTAAAISGLAASGTSAQSRSLTAPSTAGTYYYGACVESGSRETNTDNNCSTGVQVTVSTKADAARAELTRRGISYTADTFVDSVWAGNLEVVKLFVQAGMSVDTANSGKWPALHMAVHQSGNLAIVQYLVGQGASLTATNQYGNTPLHYAAGEGNLAIVQYLVGQGASLTATGADGTPLHWAAGEGNLAIVQYLVGQGASLTATGADGTPLHWAAGEDHLAIVQYLVGQGASLTATNEDGNTPLHLAALYDYLAIVQYLVGQGASLTATGADGTPLHYAAYGGHLAIVQYLVGQGASLTATNQYGYTPTTYAALYGGYTAVVTYLESQAAARASLTAQGISYTADAFVGSARAGNLEVVKLFVQAGMDVNNSRQADTGFAALHYAALYGHLEVVKYLVGRGASLTLNSNSGDTPLHYAATGHLAVVKYLVEKGARASGPTNNRGETPLYNAVRNGHLAVVKYLVEKGTNVTTANIYDNSPLHYAAQNGYLAVVKYLVEKGASFTLTNNRGETPLHDAVSHGHLAVVKYLVEKGASLTATDRHGYTPLHDAARSGRLLVVKYLVEKRASLTATTNYGQTPKDLASNQGHTAVVTYLESVGG